MDIDDVKRKTLTKQEEKLKTLSSKRNLPIPDIVYEAILEECSRYTANKRIAKIDIDKFLC